MFKLDSKKSSKQIIAKILQIKKNKMTFLIRQISEKTAKKKLICKKNNLLTFYDK